MKKILLLATGGTIASINGKRGLAPEIKPEVLLSYLPKGHYTVDSQLLMNIDSTNMQPEYWVEIAESIYKNYSDYDGFVITHGTDTMAYTSAALSYMLQHLRKPVVITGSQVPIKYEKTDAIRNLLDAFRFACEEVGGVFLVFNGRVIKGTRAIKLRTKRYDAFESVNHPYVAFIDDEKITYHQQMPPIQNGEIQLDTSLCPDVFLLKLHPGTKPELFDTLQTLYKGVIIESYGSGGIPFQGRDLLPKVKELIASGIAVVITTQCLEEGEHLHLYEVGRKVAQSKIILAKDMNTEAIVPKLMWALGKTDDLDQVKKIMETPIADEISSDSY